MNYGVRLMVEGPFALFSRPEMKVERVSYDVITPSAARGILEAIHWKPAIRWVIDKVHVLKPINFISVRRNEVEDKIGLNNISAAMKNNSLFYYDPQDTKNRQQRASMILKDVAYVIEAHFIMTDKAGQEDNPGKHLDIFNRRASRGQCFHQPCLGCREFAARFSLISHEDELPVSVLEGEKDMGWMLYDLDFSDKKDIQPIFYRPKMVNGVINVQKALEDS